MYIEFNEADECILYVEGGDNGIYECYDYVIEGHSISLGKCHVAQMSPTAFKVTADIPIVPPGNHHGGRYYVSTTAIGKERSHPFVMPGSEFVFANNTFHMPPSIPLSRNLFFENGIQMLDRTATRREIKEPTHTHRLYPCDPSNLYLSGQDGMIPFTAPRHLRVCELQHDWSLSVPLSLKTVVVDGEWKINGLKPRKFYEICRTKQPSESTEIIFHADTNPTCEILTNEEAIGRIAENYVIRSIAPHENRYLVTINCNKCKENKRFKALYFEGEYATFLEEIESPKPESQVQRRIRLD